MKTELYSTPNNLSIYSREHINSQNRLLSPITQSQYDISKSLNAYKLQIFNKDKIIMNNTKQIGHLNKKIEFLSQTLEDKNKIISEIENKIKELNNIIDNQKNEDYKNKELINKYKLDIENEMQINENNKNNYDNNYNILYEKIENSNLYLKSLEQ